MSVVLLIAIWLLLGVCLILGLALVLPLRLELQVQKEAEWDATATVRPFGRYGPRIPIKKKPPGSESRQQRKKKEKRTKRRVTARDPRASLRAVMRFVADVLRCIRVGKLSVDARLGFGDPAMTGQAFGVLCPVMYASPALPGVEVHVVPDFDRRVLTGAADIAFSVVPILLLGPIVRLGWRLFGPAR